MGLTSPISLTSSRPSRPSPRCARSRAAALRFTARGFPFDDFSTVTLGGEPARVAFASSTRLVLLVPGELEGGPTPVRLGSDARRDGVRVDVGASWATGLHQVDNPVFDRAGNLFVTYSGSRGQEAPVSIFRVTPAGTREPFASGIVNATSMAFGPDGHLYVSSRFEGAVYRVAARRVARAGGVGPRRRVRHGVRRRRLDVRRRSIGHDLPRARRTRDAVRDAAAERGGVSPGDEPGGRAVRQRADARLLRPRLPHRPPRRRCARCRRRSAGRRGWRSRPTASLHVVDALAGASGLYRFADLDGAPELVVSGGALVGVAFGPGGELVVDLERNRLPIRN